MNFLLNRLREPIQPTTPPPQCVNRINTSRWHPQHKKRPKRRFIPPFGPRYARLQVPHHYDGHFNDERGLEIGLEPLQVSFFSFFNCFFILLLTIVSHRYTMKPIGINNRVKKAQTTQDVSFGPLVSCFFFFIRFLSY